MEIPKVLVDRTEFKDLRGGLSSQHLHAEVILIDRSNSATPQVYQLSPECISTLDPYSLRTDFHSYKNDAFFYIGDLLSLDIPKRHIYLTNHNFITYKYLINFSADEHPLELSAALTTLKNALLLDALKIQERILNDQKQIQKQAVSHSFSEGSNESKEIEKIAKPQMEKSKSPYSNDIAATAKTRCQIKL